MIYSVLEQSLHNALSAAKLCGFKVQLADVIWQRSYANRINIKLLDSEGKDLITIDPLNEKLLLCYGQIMKDSNIQTNVESKIS